MKQLTILFTLLYTLSYGQMQETFNEIDLYYSDFNQPIMIGYDLFSNANIQYGSIIEKIDAPSDFDAINNYEYYRTYAPQMSFAPYPFDKVGRAIIKNEQGEYYLIDLYGDKY